MRRLTKLLWNITLFITEIFNLSTTAEYHLYEISPEHHCFYYYVLNDIVDYDVLSLPTHQIIPYCLQSLEDNHLDTLPFDDVTNNYNLSTFAQLKRNEISPENLVKWGTPIDVAERYQIFLDDPNELLSSVRFYNCTKGWYGPRCEYTFYENDLTFAELVRAVFSGKLQDPEDNNLTNGTCYIHLQCDHGPSPLCLDWREICNGNRDCADGADEPPQCFEREVNECPEGYYRCHNGQCIPEEFYNDDDDDLNPDCSDRTDIKIPLSDRSCVGDPAFRCEEHVCSGEDEFNCGDGQCAIIRKAIEDDCKHHRLYFGYRNLLSNDRNSHLSRECVFIMACLTVSYYLIANDNKCNRVCQNISMCITVLQIARCPSSPFVFPRDPVAFGHVYLMYAIDATLFLDETHLLLPYLICYDEQLCGRILNATVYYNGYTCRYPSEFDLDLSNLPFWGWAFLLENIHLIFRRCAATILSNCTYLFQCEKSSKCISKHRLLDGKRDCFDNSDEKFNNTCSRNDPYRFQCSSNQNYCISPLLVRNDRFDCPDGEDEKQLAQIIGYEGMPPFSMLCDWRVDMDPIIVDGRNQTDETDCGSYFPCNNQYTQCDGFWNCFNGIDEADCSGSLCSPCHHPCVSPLNMSIECLPLEFAGDGIVHCRGGSDERHYCRNIHPEESSRRYRCYNQTFKCIEPEILCDRPSMDTLNDNDRCDDEENNICTESFYQQSDFDGICWQLSDPKQTAAEKLLCSLDESDYMIRVDYESKLYLTLIHAGNFPSSLQEDSQENQTSLDEENVLSHSGSLLYYTHRVWFCNRGIVIFVGRLEERRCLCPPTYYGDHCQFQNERIGLILKFNIRTPSKWRTVFYLLIMLIDYEYVIQSYDYITYVPIRDCGVKFHLYLTYASRPKNLTKNYRVIINVFHRQSLTYYTSWHLPIPFQFLPVNHLVARLTIKEQITKSPNDCMLKCGRHGQCMKYENTNEDFCQCFEGWWGNLCERNYQCNCSQGSKCIGTIGNRSICLCPLGKFGSRCYLDSSSCQLDTCKHGGTCVPADERVSMENFTCLCVKEYSGKRCEISDTKIDISFDDVLIPQSFFSHFITVMDDDFHIRTTVFGRIPYDQNVVTLYHSMPFHILFVEFSKDYYLTVLQENYRPTRMISTKVFPSYHCSSIDVLFNKTILNYSRLQRIKYYHIPCQMNEKLKCFYDEEYMCLCNLDHQANCFDFDHNMTYNCQGINYCSSNGKCFQDHPLCPTASMCICDECYYGTRCEFSTKGFDLSLDAILGYQIHPHVVFTHQSLPLKVSLVITTIIFVAGLTNVILSIVTFQPKNFKVGCDIYLFASSITSLLTMIVFVLKFLVLVLSQMALITNRSLLFINCISIDFLLKFSLNIGDWLYACIAAERALTVWKGVKFNKSRSKYAAKLIVPFVYIFGVGTAIHDPIHRRLIDDNEEQRTWCIVEYSPSLKTLNLTVNIFHLLMPFIVNLISALFIIIMVARQKSTVRKNQTYRQHLIAEFHKHKHLLISPCVLLVFALPRLVISFMSRCMTSARDPWLFLVGYFLPFIPSISIFLVFILPSEAYIELLKKSFQRMRRSS